MDEKSLIERLRTAAAYSPHHADLIREAADELDDWERAFGLFRVANRRATELWHKAHPTEAATLPDQGKMIAWLCDELETARWTLAECVAILEIVRPESDWSHLRGVAGMPKAKEEAGNG